MLETMPDGPMARYRARVAQGDIQADDAQRAAVEKLQLLHQRLKGYDPRRRGFGAGLARLGLGRRQSDQGLVGLYLYGGVGRGKSMLMDLFFDTAPVRPKRRVHFHAFMAEVHVGVHVARESNVRDPIASVADEVAEEAVLLCFDEFQVTDITDAMILGRLFEALFSRGVVVVATSNREPDDLYRDGLNRALFLPFIRLLKERMDVHQLDGPLDYRIGRLATEQRYVAPLGPSARRAMDAAWDRETDRARGAPATLRVTGRDVPVARTAQADGQRVGRADFKDLCGRPLGARDFLALAERFDVFLLDDVPRLSRARFDEAKRFVTLIDALYEARVKLYMSAAVRPEALYEAGEGAFEFERTVSRLFEMQSADWP